MYRQLQHFLWVLELTKLWTLHLPSRSLCRWAIFLVRHLFLKLRLNKSCQKEGCLFTSKVICMIRKTFPLLHTLPGISSTISVHGVVKWLLLQYRRMMCLCSTFIITTNTEFHMYFIYTKLTKKLFRRLHILSYTWQYSCLLKCFKHLNCTH